MKDGYKESYPNWMEEGGKIRGPKDLLCIKFRL